MASTAEVRKQEIVEQIVAQVQDRLSGVDAEEAARFVRQYYAPVAPKDVLTRDLHQLTGAVLSLWKFAEVRDPGRVKVRVFNPQVETDGFHTDHTIAEVVNDDMPFLVDSVTGELNRHGRNVHVVIHPIVPIRRDDEGRRVALCGPSGECPTESLIHVELDQETSPEALAELERALKEVLADVRVVVEDWRPMRARVEEVLEYLESGVAGVETPHTEETRELLNWIDDDHFTFLGFREYELVSGDGEGEELEVRVVPGSGLGLLRGTDAEGFPLSPERATIGGHNPLLIISKAGRKATVHRTVHMDYVGVRQRDDTGRAVGGWSFLGLLTSGVYHSSASEIPVVRRKIDEVMERAGLPATSHDAKALLHILETFPRDELFQMTEDQLYETSLGILQLQDRQRLALFVRKDTSQRFVSCLVYVPRDRYNTDLRTRMQDILADAFGGELSAFYTQVTDAPLARAHFIIRTGPDGVPDYDVQEVENRLAEAALSWSDRLRQMLVVTRGEDRGLRLMERFGEAFPVAYQDAFDAAAALYDIDEIEAGYRTGELRTSLYRPADMGSDRMRFKIFHLGSLRPLSDVLPMLENMGLEVVFEVPYRVRPAGEDREMWIRDLGLASGDGSPIDVDRIRRNFRDTFARVWNGEVEDDSFNRLVLSAQLSWRQVVVLRAYARYLRQVGLAFSQEYMAETLGENPTVARLLVGLFETRFDPGLQSSPGDPETAGEGPAQAWAERERRSREILGEVQRALNEVSKLDQDRILRRFRNLIESTLRTNYFQTGDDDKPKTHVSFKINCRTVKALPPPRPLYEVFVYAPRVEAVHLRGGLVARGGIRWSDRPEDFRTEVLGLMKAQMVKNAVIVPVGAKGGFIVKHSHAASHEEQAAEGVEAYKTMIRGLLDLTDNLDGETVIHPRNLVRWDGEDPYLVVAADKGTARFSDIANSVASEYGFWLGDAFASGGSAGYDHKEMGITARGAWESVKRHFRELGKDVQSEPFTVVGIGDMSGDVFGNGMLSSRHIRLVGAFNHQHVFLDPDPDPEVSFAERQRLFELSRSTWADYDPKALSEGGGVFDRSAKSIPLSSQVRELLGLERESVNPNDLVKALLRTRVDLLWFGGIGTFVKATSESHAQTGDRHNDDLRVDAPELGARVVGEGANLGLTQLARIEYALGGGRINTDFIDNSGGVDCSDHEVNIKILLGEVMSRGDMTSQDRNDLLESMTEEVSRLVLRNNYLQTQAISVAEAGGVHLLNRQGELMRDLEASGKLNRKLEVLPTDDEMERRRQDGRGLTRPEIAVLLAYGKIDLYEKLLKSDLLDDPLLLRDLYLYFPTPLRERFRDEIERHRLRREIIATHVTSSMVNRVGSTFVIRLAGETGRDATDIARAYTVVRESFDLRELWEAIEALDLEVPAQTQIGLIHDAGRLVEWGTLWLLRRGTSPLDVSAAVDELKPAVESLRASLDDLLPEEDRQELARRSEAYGKKGVPRELGLRVAGLEPLGSAFDITRIARGRRHGVDDVGRIFFHLGSRFQLEWLRTRAQQMAEEGPWAKAAVDGLVEHFFTYQRELTRSVLENADGDDAESSDDDVLERWLRTRRSSVSRIDRILSELRGVTSPDLSMLMVVDHQMRLLLEE